jgi:hypothetical protein
MQIIRKSRPLKGRKWTTETVYAVTDLGSEHAQPHQLAAWLRIARLRGLDLDGLILYDIDDEAERNSAQRPFPFTPTLDPADFLADHLADWPTPVIVYRAVAKYPRADLRSWPSVPEPSQVLTVLVGAASSTTSAATSLTDAQAWSREVNPYLTVGGVCDTGTPQRQT